MRAGGPADAIEEGVEFVLAQAARGADGAGDGGAGQQGVGRGHVMLAPGQPHQPRRVVGQPAFAQGDDAAALARGAETHDGLIAGEDRQRRQHQRHAQQRRLKHQPQQAARALHPVQRQVEDDRRVLRPHDVQQGDGRARAIQRLQPVGAEQVGVGQHIDSRGRVHGQNGATLIVRHDRNPVGAGQGLQRIDIHRRAEGRAVRAFQGDARAAVARLQAGALTQVLAQRRQRGLVGQQARRANPARVLGVGRRAPLGQDDQGRAGMVDVVELLGRGAGRRRQDQQAFVRGRGQAASAHRHRHAEVSQQDRHGAEACRAARQGVAAAVVAGLQFGRIGR